MESSRSHEKKGISQLPPGVQGRSVTWKFIIILWNPAQLFAADLKAGAENVGRQATVTGSDEELTGSSTWVSWFQIKPGPGVYNWKF